MTSKFKTLKTTKALIATAAIAGLFAGSAARVHAATSDSGTAAQGSSMEKMACNGKDGCGGKEDKHDCKGKNSCKGKGGCKSGDNGCKGKNSCKGKGGCNTNAPMPEEPKK
jgi:hypothetical protein